MLGFERSDVFLGEQLLSDLDLAQQFVLEPGDLRVLLVEGQLVSGFSCGSDGLLVLDLIAEDLEYGASGLRELLSVSVGGSQEGVSSAEDFAFFGPVAQIARSVA